MPLKKRAIRVFASKTSMECISACVPSPNATRPSRPNMRLCLYTESALPMIGGQEFVVDALARQFVALGHEVVVLAPWPRHRLRTDDASLPYPVERHHRFISTHRFVDWYRRYLAKVHRRYRFDVLHCHSVYPAGYLAVRSPLTAEVPLAITSHCGDVCPANRVLAKPGVLGRYSLALRRADAAIAINRFTERRFRELCPSVRRIERIPNGADFHRFALPVPRPRCLDPAIQPRRYFLFLGRLVHRKGVDLLLDALALAKANGRLPAVIAGDGPDRSALISHAARLGLLRSARCSASLGSDSLAEKPGPDSRVRFIGPVHGTAKTWLLQNALCTVIPSRISEGFPLVLLESWAAGRPVIGTQIPGLRDLIDSHRTGILVPPDSPQDLAHALAGAIADGDRLDRLGSRARRLAQDHDWRHVAAAHLALFEELLATASKTNAA